MKFILLLIYHVNVFRDLWKELLINKSFYFMISLRMQQNKIIFLSHWFQSIFCINNLWIPDGNLLRRKANNISFLYLLDCQCHRRTQSSTFTKTALCNDGTLSNHASLLETWTIRTPDIFTTRENFSRSINKTDKQTNKLFYYFLCLFRLKSKKCISRIKRSNHPNCLMDFFQ